MKLLVIGATGGTGTEIVKQLLERDHHVSALIRDPSRFDIKHKNLSVTAGSIEEVGILKKMASDVDAVISALGSRKLSESDLQQTFARNSIASMKDTRSKRLIVISAWGVGDSKQHATFAMRLIYATFLRNIFADKNKAEKLYFASDLEYTLIKPGRLMDDKSKGNVRASVSGKPDVTNYISRTDVAAFAIDQIDSDQYSRASPIIGY